MVSLHKRDVHTILLVLECLFIKFGEAKQFLHDGFVRLVLVKSWFLVGKPLEESLPTKPEQSRFECRTDYSEFSTVTSFRGKCVVSQGWEGEGWGKVHSLGDE